MTIFSKIKGMNRWLKIGLGLSMIWLVAAPTFYFVDMNFHASKTLLCQVGEDLIETDNGYLNIFFKWDFLKRKPVNCLGFTVASATPSFDFSGFCKVVVIPIIFCWLLIFLWVLFKKALFSLAYGITKAQNDAKNASDREAKADGEKLWLYLHGFLILLVVGFIACFKPQVFYFFAIMAALFALSHFTSDWPIKVSIEKLTVQEKADLWDEMVANDEGARDTYYDYLDPY